MILGKFTSWIKSKIAPEYTRISQSFKNVYNDAKSLVKSFEDYTDDLLYKSPGIIGVYGTIRNYSSSDMKKDYDILKQDYTIFKDTIKQAWKNPWKRNSGTTMNASTTNATNTSSTSKNSDIASYATNDAAYTEPAIKFQNSASKTGLQNMQSRKNIENILNDKNTADKYKNYRRNRNEKSISSNNMPGNITSNMNNLQYRDYLDTLNEENISKLINLSNSMHYSNSLQYKENLIKDKNDKKYKNNKNIASIVNENSSKVAMLQNSDALGDVIREIAYAKASGKYSENIPRINYNRNYAPIGMTDELIRLYEESEKSIKDIASYAEKRYGMHIAASTLSKHARRKLSAQYGEKIRSRKQAKAFRKNKN